MEKQKYWYNSDGQKAFILTTWEGMILSNSMEKDTDPSEVGIFRKFAARLSVLQNEMDVIYHTYPFLSDRLLSAVDIPSIQRQLRKEQKKRGKCGSEEV